jgi:DNA-binding GntR family transcriptional regulator
MSRRNLTEFTERPKRSTTLRDVAYEAIKRGIITCAIKPGEFVNELQLAERLNIGRTPIHQALNRLMNEGLVDVISRKGVIVRPISLNEILHIVEVRLINECYCARLAAERADDKDIANLSDVAEQAAYSISTCNIENLMLLDREFHSTIARAARNAVVADLVKILHERLLRLWLLMPNALVIGKDIQQQHEAILRAIRRHASKNAEAAMRHHIEAFRTVVCKCF